MFFISKIQENYFFSLYSQKQVFKNRKQNLLLNITLVVREKPKSCKVKQPFFFTKVKQPFDR